MLKSITSREIFQTDPELKKKLWCDTFRSSGFYVNTVSKFSDKNAVLK
ncbi:transposase [Maribacter sp. ACAM166]|nr:hypothetical protein ES765_12975 [Maribacter sp. ACAM166]